MLYELTVTRILSMPYIYLYLLIYLLTYTYVYLHILVLYILNCYFVVPLPTLGQSQGDRPTIPMLITAFCLFWPEDQQEPHSKVGSLSLAKRLVGFEPRIF